MKRYKAFIWGRQLLSFGFCADSIVSVLMTHLFWELETVSSGLCCVSTCHWPYIYAWAYWAEDSLCELSYIHLFCQSIYLPPLTHFSHKRSRLLGVLLKSWNQWVLLLHPRCIVTNTCIMMSFIDIYMYVNIFFLKLNVSKIKVH